MDFSVSQWTQLIVALSLALVFFMVVYLAPHKWVFTILILLIPFQIINSKFGSLNTVFTYVVAAAMLLQGRLRYYPMLFPVSLILFAYMLSFTQVNNFVVKEHFLYMVTIGSNFLMFYIAYNFIRDSRDPVYYIRLLVALGTLVVIYCFIQLMVGFDRVSLFGIEELSMAQNRGDRRLSGPFNAVGITAEFLIIQMFILGYLLQHAHTKLFRMFMQGLIVANFALLVATGNRGGFIVLVLVGAMFLYLFRKEIGIRNILMIVVGLGFAFTVASVIVINYTEFNMLYERLERTELRQGLPDSRAKIWPLTWEAIKNKPVLGHGPRLKMGDSGKAALVDDPITYPHSVYLFLLYTIGSVGLAAYLWFWFMLFMKFHRANQRSHEDPLVGGIPRLAIVLLVVFVIDQFKIEYLRFDLSDFQHFIALLWGGLLAISELSLSRRRSRAPLGQTTLVESPARGDAPGTHHG